MKGWSERNEQAQKAYESKRDERKQAEPSTFKISKTVTFEQIGVWWSKIKKKCQPKK